MVLICPFVDATLSHPDISETDKRDLMLGPAGAREAGRLYAGELPIDHPLVSPVNADLRGFPTMQIFVATDGIASHDALILAERAREAAVEVQVGIGLMHVWPILPIPEARTSRAAMNEFLQAGRWTSMIHVRPCLQMLLARRELHMIARFPS
jgi:acetyl esterase/lipase